ncbi:hypothetical protein G6F46_004569 [Rhizopus delemar]|uniref:Uncharacterized protein n=2 Tax=Rhizopus TaxID=4842 RepID=A0A9P6ZB37_9FUNG|nr:hypothetical protein G6F31_021972 [Rhizopus arrhizus]KAG1047610.1 hypothetical protein G6F43_009952 [Rhizopus delemar]KAG1170898.1 hypothetical protein G6F36_011837 [Rhizopus arrhizus]KAG1462024.1 hypothetical protein G6F55_003218 [Rhizopus delemar]KAG1492962.1 hypothetical protein G6F54_008924 [Rhizopus delemar]
MDFKAFNVFTAYFYVAMGAVPIQQQIINDTMVDFDSAAAQSKHCTILVYMGSFTVDYPGNSKKMLR